MSSQEEKGAAGATMMDVNRSRQEGLEFLTERAGSGLYVEVELPESSPVSPSIDH